jgi:hypothetical protein
VTFKPAALANAVCRVSKLNNTRGWIQAGGSIGSRFAIFDNDVPGKNFIAIDALEPGRKVRALRPPGCAGLAAVVKAGQ